jgi:hypothetical protein
MNFPIKGNPGNEMTTAITPAGDNPFTAYANAAMANDISGAILKFIKGDWFFGQDNKPIALGTRLIANMDSFSVGWMKWVDGRPETRLVRVVDCVKPPQRKDLGDHDESLWEVDEKEKPVDPWSFVNRLVLANPTSSDLFTFTTRTWGGRKCCDLLSRDYGRAMRQHPNEWPVIELGVHPRQDRKYGIVKEPLFPIVGWIAKDAGPAAPGAPPAESAMIADSSGRPPSDGGFHRVADPLGDPPRYEDGYPGFTEDDFR